MHTDVRVIVLHDDAPQNCSDNHLCCPQNNHHSWDVVWWRGGRNE